MSVSLPPKTINSTACSVSCKTFSELRHNSIKDKSQPDLCMLRKMHMSLGYPLCRASKRAKRQLHATSFFQVLPSTVVIASFLSSLSREKGRWATSTLRIQKIQLATVEWGFILNFWPRDLICLSNLLFLISNYWGHIQWK